MSHIMCNGFLKGSVEKIYVLVLWERNFVVKVMLFWWERNLRKLCFVFMKKEFDEKAKSKKELQKQMYCYCLANDSKQWKLASSIDSNLSPNSVDNIHKLTVLSYTVVRKITERSHLCVSRYTAFPKLWVFDLVPDGPEYRKWESHPWHNAVGKQTYHHLRWPCTRL